MIISIEDFLGRVRIDVQTLEFWIEEEWLIPQEAEGGRAFSEVDLARARLIRDLTDDLGVNPEGVGIVLHLVDQMHGLRRALGDVLKAREAKQPD